LPVAVTSLRATTVRSLALAATGAVALFGSVALGGARDDLLSGIGGFAHGYTADAPLWVGTPNDLQATVAFVPHGAVARISQLRGITGIRYFQGEFSDFGGRRVWIIARPPGADRRVLESQIIGGETTRAVARLGEHGWIAVSQQIAEEHHVHVGGVLAVPTPSGVVPFRIAATTTNLAWSPGVVLIGTGDYGRYWGTGSPTALGVNASSGADIGHLQNEIDTALGPGSGLEVSTAQAREAKINALTGEGLGQLGEISMLLMLAAILALAAALASAISQRRVSLSGLRLEGAPPQRLRRILVSESALMLLAGGVAGVVAGVCGQVVIDSYLVHITGFPVATIGTEWRPILILGLVVAIALAIVAIPGWSASRVSPALALEAE
jgi:putative ABC transport system permease protein